MSRIQKRRVYKHYQGKRSKASLWTYRIFIAIMALILFVGAILMALLPAFK